MSVSFMTFFEFIKKFPTELACIEYYIKIRYGNKKNAIIAVASTAFITLQSILKTSFALIARTLFQYSKELFLRNHALI